MKLPRSILALLIRDSVTAIAGTLVTCAAPYMLSSSKGMSVRITPTLFTAAMPFVIPGFVSNMGVAILLSAFVSQEVFYKTCAVAFTLSVPISLWAMSAIQKGEEKSCWFGRNFKAVSTRIVLQKPRFRALFLLRVGAVPPSSPRLVYSCLCSLSSALFHLMLCRLALHTVKTVATAKFMATSPLLITGVALELACSVLFENQMVPIALEILDSKANKDVESAAETNTDSESDFSPEKLRSTQ